MVSLASHSTCLQWITAYESGCYKILYIFINPPSQTRLVRHASKCAWKTARNTSETIVLSCSCRSSNSLCPFIPLWGTLGFSHDIITTSHNFLARLLPFWMSYPISSFPAQTHPCACAWVSKHPAISPFFIQILKGQHLRPFSYSILWDILGLLCITSFSAFASMVSVCVSLASSVSYFCTHVLSVIQAIQIQMTTWSFQDALEELKVRGHFKESVLWSTLGLRLRDIRFTEIQTTIEMRAVPVRTFLQFINQGSFNANNLPLDGYSHTTAILLAFIPDMLLMDIERMAIGNMIQRCGSPLGDLSSIPVVMDSIRSVLASEHKKGSLKCRAYMMLIGNYGRHMAFATDPPYCVAYAADYKNTNDPSQWHPVNP